MAEGLGKGLLEIVMALIGISLIALLIRNSSGTTQVLSSAGSTLDQLLRTVSAGNSMPMSM